MEKKLGIAKTEIKSLQQENRELKVRFHARGKENVTDNRVTDSFEDCLNCGDICFREGFKI